MMIRSGSGLIVNISFWAAQKYSGNALYGCAKAATDKLTSDMAHDLAHDPGRMRRSGQVLVAAQLGLEYGFTDVDGRRPRPLGLGDA
jgi:dehydrogenase/reductase SDR family member 1